MNLDKFYTKSDVAKRCYNFLIEKLGDLNKYIFLEPSAGDGKFLPYLNNYEAYDILPEEENIIQQDFLTWEPNRFDYITIGNPPFGKRSKLAIEFFNKCAVCSNVVAFILPVSFMKYGVQKQLDSNFKLIDYFLLDENSFTSEGKDFSIRCVFQIWVKKDSEFDRFENLRKNAPSPITHNDFQIWQYNATPESLSVVDEDWEIAFYRQGYHDYNSYFTSTERESIREKMTGQKKQQFFFVKPNNEEIKQKILSMDMNLLAARNTTTPGFGKADFVEFYNEQD